MANCGNSVIKERMDNLIKRFDGLERLIESHLIKSSEETLKFERRLMRLELKPSGATAWMISVILTALRVIRGR